MTIPKDLESLTALFAKHGARKPDSWAQAQVKEGIPQLQRFLFLRQARNSVLSENDTSWIDEEIVMAERYPTGPYAGTGTALKDCLAKGVERHDRIVVLRASRNRVSI
jgi:hypothetical protein